MNLNSSTFKQARERWPAISTSYSVCSGKIHHRFVWLKIERGILQFWFFGVQVIGQYCSLKLKIWLALLTKITCFCLCIWVLEFGVLILKVNSVCADYQCMLRGLSYRWHKKTVMVNPYEDMALLRNFMSNMNNMCFQTRLILQVNFTWIDMKE